MSYNNFASSDSWETWMESTFADVDYGLGTHEAFTPTGTFADVDYGNGTTFPGLDTGSFGDVDYA